MIRRPPRSTLFPTRRSSDLLSRPAQMMTRSPRSVNRLRARSATALKFSAVADRARSLFTDRGDLVIICAGRDKRSEERRVGKSVDLGGRRIIKKKKTGDHERTDEEIRKV